MQRTRFFLVRRFVRKQSFVLIENIPVINFAHIVCNYKIFLK